MSATGGRWVPVDHATKFERSCRRPRQDCAVTKSVTIRGRSPGSMPSTQSRRTTLASPKGPTTSGGRAAGPPSASPGRQRRPAGPLCRLIGHGQTAVLRPTRRHGHWERESSSSSHRRSGDAAGAGRGKGQHAGVPLRRFRAVEELGRLSPHPQGRPCGRPPGTRVPGTGRVEGYAQGVAVLAELRTTAEGMSASADRHYPRPF
jgi:hypothetical protein